MVFPPLTPLYLLKKLSPRLSPRRGDQRGVTKASKKPQPIQNPKIEQRENESEKVYLLLRDLTTLLKGELLGVRGALGFSILPLNFFRFR
jgi:hypothetical protein